ncbi:MAG: hypothetical protein CXT73_02915 [Methanobacteriota archaeon]|jgi:hypothetical protein|nr:MAG: hypothetical protein CXT73_02915 [Euryarchaeota archaeon]
MELEQIVMVVLILIIVYMLLQMSQQKPQSERVVYLQSPYIGRGFGQGPMWHGPRPGRRHGRRSRLWF